jgi:hypothetical protein
MPQQTLISSLLTSALFVSTALAQTGAKPLGNEDVRSLARAGLADNTILTVIGAQASKFDVSGGDLLKLKQVGVSPKVVAAMVSAASTPPVEEANTLDESVITDNPSPSAPAPAAPAKKKRSWLKSLASNAAVGQALVAAVSQFANQTDPVTGEVKNAILSRVTGVASGLLNGRQPDASMGSVIYQSPEMAVPYPGGMIPSQPAPIMMSPAYGYPAQGQPMMMQPAMMPSAPSGEIPPAPFMMNVRPSVPVADSTAEIVIVNGQPMVRLVSPDGQTVVLSLGNQLPHEVPAATPKSGSARAGESQKAAFRQ